MSYDELVDQRIQKNPKLKLFPRWTKEEFIQKYDQFMNDPELRQTQLAKDIHNGDLSYFVERWETQAKEKILIMEISAFILDKTKSLSPKSEFTVDTERDLNESIAKEVQTNLKKLNFNGTIEYEFNPKNSNCFYKVIIVKLN